MSAAVKKVADALQKLGQQFAPEDKHLVHVNDAELRMLEKRSGKGVPNPISGIPQYWDGADNADNNGSQEGGAGGNSNANSDASYGGGSTDTYDNNSYDVGDSTGYSGGPSGSSDGYDFSVYDKGDMNVESAGIMAGTNGTPAAVSGQFGPEADATAANAEYESIYGEAPAIGADRINDAYSQFMSEVNSAGNLGRFAGTFYDALMGAKKGSSLGPIGMIGGGILGGVTGKNGDRGYDAGRGLVQGSLLDGSWGLASEFNGDPDGTGGFESDGRDYSFDIPQFTEPTREGGGAVATPSFGGIQYADYIPASAPVASPPSPVASNYGGWQTMGGVSGPSEAGGDPYDAVDFLERQKKEAAIRDALLGQQQRGKEDQRIPSLEEFLGRRG